MWYFKGRRRRYDSPYTGKEVDAAVAKAETIPDVTVAEAGKFLRVNNDGKIDAVEYPVETQVDVVYSGNVTTTESPETVSVVAFSGTAEDFSQLNVVVNNETLVYNSDYSSFDDANETVSILFADGYIKLFAYNANTFAVEIKQITETIDEEFAEGVEEVAKNKTVNFTNVRVDAEQFIENPPINVYLTSQDILTLMGGNSVTKPVSGLDRLAPRTFLIIAVTPSILSLNLNMISGNQIIYSGILAVENSTAILSASITPNGNLFEAVITATTIS